MYQSTKVLELGSAAFRQWRATHSHCQHLHGYDLKAKIWFESKELDERNWVQDFGDFDTLKTTLRNLFDHKLVVAADDPQLESFKLLEKVGACELTILADGVGCERFAEEVYKHASDLFDNDRVTVAKVELFEHDRNSAIYEPYNIDFNLKVDADASYQDPKAVTEDTPAPAADSKIDPLAPDRRNKTWDMGTTWA